MHAEKSDWKTVLSLQTIIPGVLFAAILLVIATNMPTLPAGQLMSENLTEPTMPVLLTPPYPAVPEGSKLEPHYYPPPPTLNAVMP